MSAATTSVHPAIPADPAPRPEDSGPPPADTGLLSAAGLWHALGRDRRAFVFTVVMNSLTHLSGALAAGAGAWAVSAAVLGAAPADLAVPALLVAGAVVVRSVAAWMESWIGHALSFRVMARLRGWIYTALARLAPTGLAGRRSGDLATTTLTDAEILEVFYAHSSVYVASSILTTPLVVAGIAILDVPTALVLIPVLAVVTLVPLALRRRALREGAAIRALVADLGSEVAENTGAVREIVGFGLVDVRAERVATLDRRLGREQLANARRAGLETALVGVMSFVGVIAVGLLGAQRVAAGEVAPGLLPVLMTLAGVAPAALLQLIGVTRHTGTLGRAAARVGEVLYATPAVDRSGSGALTAAPERGDVAIEGVSFTWPDVDGSRSGPTAHPATVADVTVRMGSGSTVALAGRSGAGKSTLAALLARSVDPDRGTVEVAGSDLRELGESALADAVCLVPQEVFLFHDTIRANLLLAAPVDPAGAEDPDNPDGPEVPTSDDDLWRVLEVSGAADLVRRLPDGLDTMVGARGSTLSGGERQRLALARSLLRTSRVLVLDESVSQLDVASERDVRDALRRTRTGRTTVVIAHRLSTLLGAERIVVLDAGRVVGDGTHAELLADCATYQALVGPQLEALAPSSS